MLNEGLAILCAVTALILNRIATKKAARKIVEDNERDENARISRSQTAILLIGTVTWFGATMLIITSLMRLIPS